MTSTRELGNANWAVELWTSWDQFSRYLPPGTNTTIGRWTHSSLMSHFATGHEWIDAYSADPEGVEAALARGDRHPNLPSARRRLVGLWGALTKTPLPSAFVFQRLRLGNPVQWAQSTGLLTSEELALIAPSGLLSDVVKACLYFGLPFREWSDREQTELKHLATQQVFGTFFSVTRFQTVLTLLRQQTLDVELVETGPWVTIDRIGPLLGLDLATSSSTGHVDANLVRLTCQSMVLNYENGPAWLAAIEAAVKSNDNWHNEISPYEMMCGLAWAALTHTPLVADVALSVLRLPWLHLAEQAQLLTPEESKLLKSTPYQAHGLVRYCIVFGKPFRQWTDREIDQIPLPQDERYGKVTGLTPWFVSGLRVKLGYSSERPRYRQRKTARSEIEEQAPKWGRALDQWEAYLVAQGYAETTRESRVLGVCRWLNWLFDQGVETAAALTDTDLAVWYQSTTPSRSSCYAVRDFLAWGTKAKVAAFPREVVSLPLDVMQAMSREVTAAFKNVNRRGRGTGLADVKIFLQAAYRMSGETEAEVLSKQLVLLMACTGQRLSYYLDLEADALVENLASPGLLTLASAEAVTKQNTLNATNAILDEEIGHSVVRWLRKRIAKGQFQAITNERTNRTYVHLFSLSEPPYVLLQHHVKQYVNKVKAWAKNEMAADLEALGLDGLESTCHSLRHFLIGLVLAETKNQDIAQAVGNHLNSTQSGVYQRSMAAQTMLIMRLDRLYKEKRITGGFVVQMLTALEAYVENEELDEMMGDLFSAMTFEEYLVKYGRPTALGLCMKQGDCEHLHRCWSCIHHVFRREDVENGLTLLKDLWLRLLRLMSVSLHGGGPIHKDQRNAILSSHFLVIKSVLQRLLDVAVPLDEILRGSMPEGVNVGELLAKLDRPDHSDAPMRE